MTGNVRYGCGSWSRVLVRLTTVSFKHFVPVTLCRVSRGIWVGAWFRSTTIHATGCNTGAAVHTYFQVASMRPTETDRGITVHGTGSITGVSFLAALRCYDSNFAERHGHYRLAQAGAWSAEVSSGDVGYRDSHSCFQFQFSTTILLRLHKCIYHLMVWFCFPHDASWGKWIRRCLQVTWEPRILTVSVSQQPLFST
jgi:hypothetical protein